MGDDQWQRVLVLGLDMDEVDVHPIKFSLELRESVQSRLALAPVVVRRPIARERLHRRQLHALRPIGDELLVGQAGGGDAPAQVVEVLLWDVHLEWADDCLACRRVCHGSLSLPGVA